MKKWQKRVVKEKKKLDKKIGRLNKFLSENGKVNLSERCALVWQLMYMKQYSMTLAARIRNFK